MTSRWARFVRGQVVAVFATFAAAFSHGFADGAHPPLVAVVLALAFSSVACAILATSGLAARLSRTRLAASVAVSQLLYHGLFSLFGPAATPSGAVVSGHHGSVTFLPGGAEPVAVAAPDQWVLDQWMLAAHLVAAAVTYAMLVRGERTLLAIAEIAVLLIAAIAWRLPRVPGPLAAPARFPRARLTEAPGPLLLLVSSLSHRGPPRFRRFA